MSRFILLCLFAVIAVSTQILAETMLEPGLYIIHQTNRGAYIQRWHSTDVCGKRYDPIVTEEFFIAKLRNSTYKTPDYTSDVVREHGKTKQPRDDAYLNNVILDMVKKGSAITNSGYYLTDMVAFYRSYPNKQTSLLEPLKLLLQHCSSREKQNYGNILSKVISEFGDNKTFNLVIIESGIKNFYFGGENRLGKALDVFIKLAKSDQTTARYFSQGILKDLLKKAYEDRGALFVVRSEASSIKKFFEKIFDADSEGINEINRVIEKLDYIGTLL